MPGAERIPERIGRGLTPPSGLIPVKYVVEEPTARVGSISIDGNTKTRMKVILERVALYPGQVLDMAELRKTEEKLVRLNRFVVDPAKGIRPTVTILDNPNDPESEYKDILITIEEKESTHFFHVICDELDEWGYLLDVRTRVL